MLTGYGELEYPDRLKRRTLTVQAVKVFAMKSENVESEIAGPFFSIGVTTYNRKEMLKECLDSVLAQTFTDYEVIVGNDYTDEELSADMFGINDNRIKFVNYPRNLGEVGNMNKLLSMSQGKYFTWTADDDMYSPIFFETVYESLNKLGVTPCVFTSFTRNSNYLKTGTITDKNRQLLTGREFLQLFLNRDIKLLGSCAFFEKSYLQKIGGIKKLGDGFGPCSDSLLAIRAGVLKKVIFVDAPLVFFRRHDESVSFASGDIHALSSAHEELMLESIDIFKSKELIEDFHSNLFFLLKWCVIDYFVYYIKRVVIRTGKLRWGNLIKYLLFIWKHIIMLIMEKFKRLGNLLLIYTVLLSGVHYI